MIARQLNQGIFLCAGEGYKSDSSSLMNFSILTRLPCPPEQASAIAFSRFRFHVGSLRKFLVMSALSPSPNGGLSPECVLAAWDAPAPKNNVHLPCSIPSRSSRIFRSIICSLMAVSTNEERTQSLV